jgi:bifunctional DNA-binding transcriptional regulator/antitoxin component of YhaV-PrlF toxin-antitoxin module
VARKSETTADAQIDEDGRLYVPKASRKALGIEDTSANVTITITVNEVYDE